MYAHANRTMCAKKKTKKKKRTTSAEDRKRRKADRFATKKGRVRYCKKKGVEWLGTTASRFGVPFADIIGKQAAKYLF